MTSSSIAIQVSGLSKSFKGGIGGMEVHALVDVSLEVNRGEIFGLLGPNGAGKTTMVKTLIGALNPTSGRASIDGVDINHSKSRDSIGFLPENHRFPSYLTGYQMLSCFGGMSGLSREQIRTKATELLEMVDMAKWRDTKIRKYSKGMMQRLGLAQALINDPNIIFLDEPTDGVDPIGRHEIRKILLKQKKAGKTIFLNSHLLAEVETICDRVAVLDKGRLLKIGPASGLVGVKPAYRIEVNEIGPDTIAKIKMAFTQAEIENNAITITFEDATQVNKVIDILRQNDVTIISATPVKMSLEESFIQLIRGEGGGDE